MLSSIKKYTLLQVICLFSLSLMVFMWGIRSQEVTGFDSRFYLFALEMWDRGLSFFPTTYHQPYPDYSSASTLLIFLVAKLKGGVDKFAAILPTAICASATIVFTYLIASVHSKRWGIYAIFFLWMTISFLQYARSITLDMYSTLFTVVCFYVLIISDIKNKPKLANLIYPFLFLGFVFRGPIGLVIPTSVVITYYLVDRDIKKLIRTGFFAFLLLTILSLVLLMLAYIEGGYPLAHDVFRMQGLSRIDNQFQPYYFYFINSVGNYALCFPMMFIVMLELGISYFSSQNKTQNIQHPNILLKLLAWVFVILIGMSIPGDKKPRYILPMVPALSLIASYILIAAPTEKVLFYFQRLIFKFFKFFPLMVFALTLYILWYAKTYDVNIHIRYLFVLTILLIPCVAMIFSPSRSIAIVFNAAISFIIIFIYVIEPITLYLDKTNHFVNDIEHERLKRAAPLVFYLEPPDGMPIKYLINMPHRAYPQFIQSQKELESYSQPSFIITSKSHYALLPDELKSQFNVVAEDKVGHVKVVVFTNGIRS